MIEEAARPIGWRTVTAIMMSAVLVTAATYSFFTPLNEARVAAHREVVTLAASAPDRYRVLVPFALDGPIHALAAFVPYDKAVERVYGVFHLVALSLILIALVLQLSLWFTTVQSLAGALMVGSLVQLALRQQEYDLSSIPDAAVFAPHSLLEPVVIALGCVLARRGRQWPLAALTAVAALNSEAAIILPLLYIAVLGVSRASVLTAIGYAVIWGAVTLTLRLALGESPSVWTVREIWRENMAHLPTAFVNVALFLGPLWVVAAVGWRRAPGPIRRTAWLTAPYVAAVGVWGFWWDVRLLLGLYPLLMPLVLSAVFAPRPNTT